MILAGDVGGTKTVLAFFEVAGRRLRLVAEERFISREHDGLDQIAKRFVSQHRYAAEAACFGIAGPCRHGECETTNLPWHVEARQLAADLGIGQIDVINDLAATAYAVPVLDETDMAVLNAGAADAEGNAAVIAAGTGLGEAGLFWDGNELRPFACEGGHSDFGPRDELEVALFDWLREQYGHVSWERVLSGPGLYNIYRFLSGRSSQPAVAAIARAIEEGDQAAEISRAALARTCPVCEEAVERFLEFYGAEAGNLALKVMATGGVYVAGGIAARMPEQLQHGRFLEAFVAKGRMRSLMESMPIRVVLNSKAALIGAARCAWLRRAGRLGALPAAGQTRPGAERSEAIRLAIRSEYGDCPNEMDEARRWHDSISESLVQTEVEEMWPGIADEWWKENAASVIRQERDRLLQEATSEAAPHRR